MSFRFPLSLPRIPMTARLVALAILLGTGAGIGVGQAQVSTAILGVCTYYSDNTFTHVIGARGTGCCGEVINWGSVSQFRVCERIFCTDIVCPNVQSHSHSK
jgi:hypothetical protein